VVGTDIGSGIAITEFTPIQVGSATSVIRTFRIMRVLRLVSQNLKIDDRHPAVHSALPRQYCVDADARVLHIHSLRPESVRHHQIYGGKLLECQLQKHRPLGDAFDGGEAWNNLIMN